VQYQYGRRFNITAYVMNATLLQMATMRRLTMSFMPNAANTKAEATTLVEMLIEHDAQMRALE